MLEELLLPLLLLACIGVGFLWVAKTSGDRKELQKRLENVVAGSGLQQLNREVSTNIRVRQEAASHFSAIARLLKVPKDVPLAHVCAPFWIFGFGIVCSGLFFWLSQFLLPGPASVGVGLLAGLLLVRGVFGWEIGRYEAKLVSQLPDTVQLVVSATRAGLPVSEAFRAVADEMPSPTREEFIRVVNEIALGSSPDAALLSLHHRTGVTEYAIFAVTIGVQARSGGRLAETIQNLAEIVRERLTIAARARALSGEAKASAVILGILPIVSGGISAITQPDQIAILFTDPRGTRLLAIGIITLLVGALTMRQLIIGATKE